MYTFAKSALDYANLLKNLRKYGGFYGILEHATRNWF